ncbi:OLC1v1020357C1 [Oldenlandia corymbosa var. corymbosa]|uniref:OLC1v1020357C1 n=1 Tax=Oldenlandia corymbosa var. corymbosa TaxID=529605 RepID=A0AAV1EGD1_OLDCO|nr:OLC1v1020357C1 [Oldenlandia corymbosa var. corymbosa]
MVITLKKELMIRSHKTVDGRGVRVEITRGPCIGIENVKHVIIHGINIHDCRRRVGLVQIPPTLGSRGKVGCSEDEQECSGDAVNIKNSSHIWIDHCYLSNCTDGLIDVNHASNNVTISNSRFTNHVKV